MQAKFFWQHLNQIGSNLTGGHSLFDAIALVIVIKEPSNDGSNFDGFWQVGIHSNGGGAASVKHMLGSAHALEPFLPRFAVRRP